MRWGSLFAGLACVSVSWAARAAPPEPHSSATMDLSRLLPQAVVSWLELETTRPAQVLAASWSRAAMAQLAENVAEDGTPYLQLPLVRLYDGQGRRLKLRSDVTDPHLSAARLNEAVARREIDTESPTLMEDLALLTFSGGAGFDAAEHLPEASFYVIDYGAEWCRTSAPFRAALDAWHEKATASAVVMIKANADFGQRRASQR